VSPPGRRILRFSHSAWCIDWWEGHQEGPLGVVQEGDYAVILADGNPRENLDLVVGPEENFAINMKDGVIYKNTVQ